MIFYPNMTLTCLEISNVAKMARYETYVIFDIIQKLKNLIDHSHCNAFITAIHFTYL